MTKTRINIIGNGESRLSLKDSNLVDFSIGCNAVFRDIPCNLYVAVDRRIVDEFLVFSSTTIYTRKDWESYYSKQPNVRYLPDLPYQSSKRQDQQWHWGTGPQACLLAASLNPSIIDLWGFDLWGINKKVNNVYKETINYCSRDKSMVDPRYWIYQMQKCFELFPHIQWIQHQPKGWKKPVEWQAKNLIISHDCLNT